MNDLTFRALALKNKTRHEKIWRLISRWSASDWAITVASEVGELCQAVQELRRLDDLLFDDSFDRAEAAEELIDQVAEELADVIISSDLLASRLGIDLDETIRQRFNKMSKEVGSDIRL